jgi:hypothetical protein
MSWLGWLDGVGGDDGLVGVAGGFDLLQAAIALGREHRAGRGRALREVVVVAAGVPGGEGVLDRPRLRMHHSLQVGCEGPAHGNHQVVRVDAGLGAAAGGGAGEGAAEVADLDGGQQRVGVRARQPDQGVDRGGGKSDRNGPAP